MCTVTLSHQEDGFILTSNRDEAVARGTLPPREYVEDQVRLLYPRDLEAGGTWIGMSDRNRVICLLNGGFEPHKRQPPYRKSRGLVVKDFLKATDFSQTAQNYKYDGIEPFTCVIVDCPSSGIYAYQLVWDGSRSHFKNLEVGSYIWSSSLLYSQEVREDRERRFMRFKSEQELTADNLLNFHGSKGSQKGEGLIIDRGFLKTRSITQVQIKNGKLAMYYQDLLEDAPPLLLSFT